MTRSSELSDIRFRSEIPRKASWNIRRRFFGIPGREPVRAVCPSAFHNPCENKSNESDIFKNEKNVMTTATAATAVDLLTTRWKQW
jgi:hypothetical protein